MRLDEIGVAARLPGAAGAGRGVAEAVLEGAESLGPL